MARAANARAEAAEARCRELEDVLANDNDTSEFLARELKAALAKAATARREALEACARWLDENDYMDEQGYGPASKAMLRALAAEKESGNL
jgi:hypothetical protein